MKSQYRPLFAFAALLLTVGLACKFLTGPAATEAPPVEEPPTTEATDAPEQPQTEEPTSAPTEAPVQQSSAEQYFTEEFDTDISNWSRLNVTGSKETNVDGLKLEVKDSRLVFDFDTKQLYTYLFYDPFEYENVTVEASAENRGM
ncbi:MAG: hypothetical protein HY865_05575, partial [Chloroflexi bacterium]|nr:hypothetical protein [Chloroflexota bacterium]